MKDYADPSIKVISSPGGQAYWYGNGPAEGEKDYRAGELEFQIYKVNKYCMRYPLRHEGVMEATLSIKMRQGISVWFARMHIEEGG